MRYSFVNRGFPAGNPIANALVIVVGALVIAASIVVGFFAFLALAAALLVMAAVVGIRLWWFNRKLARKPASGSGSGRVERTIEGEYVVIVRDEVHRSDGGP